MAYIWFNLVLEALGKRLNYESISNIYGNSFAKDSAKIVQQANPLLKQGKKSGLDSIMGAIHINTAKTAEESAEKTAQVLGDMDWIMRGEGQ